MIRTQCSLKPLRLDGAVNGGRSAKDRGESKIYRVKARSGSDHHKIDAAVFEAFPHQTIPCHRFDPVPVLTEIAPSLMLGRKFGLQTAGLTRISVCDLEKHRLPSLFLVGLNPRSIAHRLFL
jgi:hypothetical protein